MPNTTGGISTYYQNILPALAGLGCEITVIHGSATHSGTSHFRMQGIDVYDLDRQLFSLYKEKFKKFEIYPSIRSHLAAAWAMYEQAQSMGAFDFIETCDFGWGYIPWAFHNHTNLSVTFHATLGEIDERDPIPGKALQEDICRMIDLASMQYVYRFIASTNTARTSWEARLNKSVSKHLPAYIIPAESNIASLENTQQYGLVVGRVQHWKGPTVLCEAVTKMKDTAPSIYWLGRDMPYQASTMDEYLTRHFPGVWKSSIRPLGQKDRAQTKQYQAAADFIIIPSVWDIFNFTCIEAMAYGKVVICSTGAGASDIIEDGINGFLFDNEDADALAIAIQRVKDLTVSEKREIGSRARNTVATILDPEKRARERLAWYLGRPENAEVPLSPWVMQWLSPHSTESTIEKTLEDISLKNLVDHTLKRLVRKVI